MAVHTRIAISSANSSPTSRSRRASQPTLWKAMRATLPSCKAGRPAMANRSKRSSGKICGNGLPACRGPGGAHVGVSISQRRPWFLSFSCWTVTSNVTRQKTFTRRNRARACQNSSVKKRWSGYCSPRTSKLIWVCEMGLVGIDVRRGLRVSEACGLKVSDIDLDAALVTCHGKGNKERRIPLGKSAIDWLQRYLAIRKEFGNEGKPQLFLHRGRTMTRHDAWRIIKTHAVAAGVPDISPHTLRHSLGRT